MTYRISGLEPGQFAPLFTSSIEQLRHPEARLVTATAKLGYPCRVSLEDAEPGERLILLNHVLHDVATSFRTAYAIYVRGDAHHAAEYVDELPPVFATRALSLRGFCEQGMLRDAKLAQPEEADGMIRHLFDNDDIAYIHAHYTAPGCFAAKIERTR